MKSCMVRTFHAVGQGAFYTEYFEDMKFTMVYDCGTYHKKKIIDINDMIKKGIPTKTIDLLCISHFHKDHINGLEYILTNYNVKKILLPYMHKEIKEEVFLTNVIEESSEFIQNLSLNPIKVIKEKSQYKNISIVSVKALSEDSRQNDQIIDVTNVTGDINSGTMITIDHKWIYVPFNSEYTTGTVSLKKKLLAEGVCINDVEEFKSEYLKNKKKIKSIFKSILKVKNSENIGSLVLYSANSLNCTGDICLNYTASCVLTMKNVKCGCLYMGDYDAKTKSRWEELKKVFLRYCTDVGTIQIPHHGSSHNYNKGLNFKECIYCVISAGDTIYRHPHASTVKSIVLARGIPVIVTEDIKTTFIQKIIL